MQNQRAGISSILVWEIDVIADSKFWPPAGGREEEELKWTDLKNIRNIFPATESMPLLRPVFEFVQELESDPPIGTILHCMSNNKDMALQTDTVAETRLTSF